MNGYPPTPVLSEHARRRCAEMGVSTKVVKRIVRNATLRLPGYDGPRGEPRTMLRDSTNHPDLCVIVEDIGGEVVTVMWWSPEKHQTRETCQGRRHGSRKG